MKCRVCRGPAVIDVRRHNANFCAPHFVRYCRDQLARAIKEFDMISEGDSVLVAVSGGKDSLAVWDLLNDAGYRVDGLYVGLGIGDYSDESRRYAQAFADARGLRLLTVDVEERFGYTIPDGSKAARRAPCSACGLTKRHIFDETALEFGYDVLATGHNLDDEAAVLFGNVMHWETAYLGRQRPVLDGGAGFPKKVKPLIRLAERELAAYCVIQGIEYIVDECPMAAGNRHLGYKEILNDMERRSPGAKANFYLGFLARGLEHFDDEAVTGRGELGRCERCGAPSAGEVCAFCRLVERATTKREERA